jgi:hypothetical protein
MPLSINIFVIVGPDDGSNQLFFKLNAPSMWVPLGEATHFPVEVLNETLPPGASGIMELTPQGDYVNFYKRI